MHVLGYFKKVGILQYTNAQTVAKYFVAIVIYFFMKPYILVPDVLVLKGGPQLRLLSILETYRVLRMAAIIQEMSSQLQMVVPRLNVMFLSVDLCEDALMTGHNSHDLNLISEC